MNKTLTIKELISLQQSTLFAVLDEIDVTEIPAIKLDIQRIDSDIAKISQDIFVLDARTNTLSQDMIKALADSSQALETSQNALEQAEEALSTIDSINTQIVEIQNTLNGVTGDIAHLNVEVITLQSQIDAINTTLNCIPSPKNKSVIYISYGQINVPGYSIYHRSFKFINETSDNLSIGDTIRFDYEGKIHRWQVRAIASLNPFNAFADPVSLVQFGQQIAIVNPSNQNERLISIFSKSR